MEYNEGLYSELALKLIEGDIRWVARQYSVPGYDLDDLQQELRLIIWAGLTKYNPALVSFRTWANVVMRNRLRELLRNSLYDCRKVAHFSYQVKDINNFYEELGDLNNLLDKLHENGMTFSEIMDF